MRTEVEIDSARRSTDRDIAIIGERLNNHIKTSNEHFDSMSTSILKLLDSQTKVMDELNLYKTIYKFIKFLGAAFVAVITLKLGDIHGIWSKFFG